MWSGVWPESWSKEVKKRKERSTPLPSLPQCGKRWGNGVYTQPAFATCSRACVHEMSLEVDRPTASSSGTALTAELLLVEVVPLLHADRRRRLRCCVDTRDPRPTGSASASRRCRKSHGAEAQHVWGGHVARVFHPGGADLVTLCPHLCLHVFEVELLRSQHRALDCSGVIDSGRTSAHDTRQTTPPSTNATSCSDGCNMPGSTPEHI